MQLDIKETYHNPIRYLKGDGKESISAYIFDGLNLKLIYRIAYGEALNTHVDYQKANLPMPMRWMCSLGHLWEWGAYYCHGNRHEAGKLMGLAPFGNPNVHSEFNTLAVDEHGEVTINLQNLINRFQSPNLTGADVSSNSHYTDIAAHIQQATNKFTVELVRFLQMRFKTNNLCYSGGVALNSSTNQFLKKQLGLSMYMNGSCEDNGTAIGAALAVHHSFTGLRHPEQLNDCYGMEYSFDHIQKALKDYSGKTVRLKRNKLLEYVAKQIASGLIVGWFQGRSEFGPRALGNRSILADPRSPFIQAILNERVKYRESFRPFAPSVTEERASEFFELDGPSPAMLLVVPVRVNFLPGITHIDGTARVQTVNHEQNPIFYDLLKAYEKLTGIPILLNTSFNTAGEPIVETPSDALRAFLSTNIDLLIMGDFIIHRP